VRPSLITRGTLFLTLALAVPVCAAEQSPPPKWQAGVSVFNESGDYGTPSKTTTAYVPFSLRRYFSQGELQLTIPFVSIDTEGQVVLVGGVPNVTGTGAPAARRTSHSGLGDIVLKGRYYLINEGPRMPEIDLAPKIKFPTARASDNLGTGEYDEGLSVELTKILGERYIALAEAGYTHLGDPPGEDFNNPWDYSVGGGYYILPAKWEVSINYEERRNLFDSEPNPRDLFFYTEIRAAQRLKFTAGVEVGLSGSAADYGVEVGSRLKF
jgi:hypothetical protein